jgi:hypothetical protein
MLVKKYATKQNLHDSFTYRFDYEEWDMIVTFNPETRLIHGTAICQMTDDAPVYVLTYEEGVLSGKMAVADMVGNLAYKIAENFALNCLDQLEEDEADRI